MQRQSAPIFGQETIVDRNLPCLLDVVSHKVGSLKAFVCCQAFTTLQQQNRRLKLQPGGNKTIRRYRSICRNTRKIHKLQVDIFCEAVDTLHQ